MRVNDRIRAPEVRVIDPEGVQLGMMPVPDALARARDLELDLIEVAPQAKPPVCKIMDYGKFRYEQRKSQRESAKKAKTIELKSLRVRPGTDKHDIAFKIRNAQRFLYKGKKVKFTVIFRGPELRHPEIGRDKLVRIAKECEPYGEVEVGPHRDGRQMHMVLTPKAGAPLPPSLKEKDKKEEKSEAEARAEPEADTDKKQEKSEAEAPVEPEADTDKKEEKSEAEAPTEPEADAESD